MLRIVVSLSAALLAASPTPAQLASRSLCDVGSSIFELIHFEHTVSFNPTVHGPINPIDLRSSIIFLTECPARVVATFSHYPEETELRLAWINAIRAAAQDSSNVDVRAFLAAGEANVARLGNPSLNEFLDGIFDAIPRGENGARQALEAALDRQASVTLKRYAECDGAGCFDASDNILFLLGAHPIAVFKAMRADSANAATWLRDLADESFSGPPERREGREAARQDLLKTVSTAKAPGLERQRRACEDTLSKIRYRSVD